MTTPSGLGREPSDDTSLTYADLEGFVERSGVSVDHVRRDHLVSQLLVGIGHRSVRNDVIFFGGTALTQTHLRDLRLSEDIDLIATSNRNTVAAQLVRSLDRAVARTHGKLRWDPPLHQATAAGAAVLRTRAGLAGHVQLLSSTGSPAWPTEGSGPGAAV